ncbi:hypothetical protein [Blautia hominis]|uniref:hypothetical protein n=1 Tax=Blautia hominis TaxID=2025493 RepID=UPI0025922E5C|nr:hypothetical protein [uncultured Blautia sp.]
MTHSLRKAVSGYRPAGWFGKGVELFWESLGCRVLYGCIMQMVVHEASDRIRYPGLFVVCKGPEFRIAYGLG